jgi:hypothetical protein
MNTRIWILFAFITLSYGCKERLNLQPAAGARLTAQDDGAVAVVSGVRTVVELTSWPGQPRNLKRIVTPIRVTVINGSNYPLKIRRSEFSLRTPDGLRYTALPPQEIKSSSAVTRTPLPTHDMISAAFPEGVLAPQSRISGFLYFELIDQNLKEITFHLDLMSAPDEAAIGQVSIPFVVR